MHLFYLHGFASSAGSSKAAFFAAKLREHGLALHTPDFNVPDFSTLTVTRMVDQVVAEIEALPPGPVVLIGSSLGAFVAVAVAGRLKSAPTGAAGAGSVTSASAPGGRQVDRLVLLAPALEFATRRDFQLGDRSLEEWERTGTTNVFHYGYGRVVPVHYALYVDACGYDCLNAALDLPIQVFMGRKDSVVDPAGVERWARRRPNVELHLLDDDHQLGASLEFMWREMHRFLALQTPNS
ncbi:MAG TPA: YqiA/YcfP family alpha/beta fold hydrolase [Vicinamibacterales bacterium]|nr:YqiA/YcfP family alpha/beta fold hydrolase [Vicinamibacterales bacterium]